MKEIGSFEAWMYWIIAIIAMGFCFYVGYTMITDKDRMCRDIGKVVYHRELSWFECISL